MRLTSETMNSDNSFVPHLFTTNAQVDMHNMDAFEIADEEKKCIISALDTVGGDVNEKTSKKNFCKVPDDPARTMGLVRNLMIVENLPDEICLNIGVKDGLTNGYSCTVKKLDFRVENSNRCSIIWVEFENRQIGSKTRTKYAHLYTSTFNKTWTPIIEITRNFNIGQNRTNACVIRRQFPLRLACAKTIHKSQGSTMNQAVLHFGNRKTDHMHYVGLSRIRR